MPTEPIKNEIVVGVVQEDPTLYILGRYVSPITIKTLDGKYETVARVVSVQDACAYLVSANRVGTEENSAIL